MTNLQQKIETAKKQIAELQNFINEVAEKNVLPEISSEDLMRELAARDSVSDKEKEFLLDFAKENCDFSELIYKKSSYDLLQIIFDRFHGSYQFDDYARDATWKILLVSNFKFPLGLYVSRAELNWLVLNESKSRKISSAIRGVHKTDYIGYSFEVVRFQSPDSVEVKIRARNLETILYLGKHIDCVLESAKMF